MKRVGEQIGRMGVNLGMKEKVCSRAIEEGFIDLAGGLVLLLQVTPPPSESSLKEYLLKERELFNNLNKRPESLFRIEGLLMPNIEGDNGIELFNSSDVKTGGNPEFIKEFIKLVTISVGDANNRSIVITGADLEKVKKLGYKERLCWGEKEGESL